MLTSSLHRLLPAVESIPKFLRHAIGRLMRDVPLLVDDVDVSCVQVLDRRDAYISERIQDV